MGLSRGQATLGDEFSSTCDEAEAPITVMATQTGEPKMMADMLTMAPAAPAMAPKKRAKKKAATKKKAAKKKAAPKKKAAKRKPAKKKAKKAKKL